MMLRFLPMWSLFKADVIDFYPIFLTLRCSACLKGDIGGIGAAFNLRAAWSLFENTLPRVQDADEEDCIKCCIPLVKMWAVLIITWSLALIAFKMWVACAVIGLDWHISLLTFYKLPLASNIPAWAAQLISKHYGGSFLQRLRYNGIKNSCRNSYILFFAFYWELLQQFSTLASNSAMKFVKYLNCSKVLWGRLQLALPSSFQEKIKEKIM